MKLIVTLEIQNKATGKFEAIIELNDLSITDLYSLYGLHDGDHFSAVELSESDFDFLAHSYLDYPKPDFSKKRVFIDVSTIDNTK